MTLPKHWNQKYNLFSEIYNLKSQIKNIKAYTQQDHSQGNAMVLQKCTNSPLMEILITYHYDQSFLILILQHPNQQSFCQNYYHHYVNQIVLEAALQINICPLLVTMNRKIKQPLVKLNFQWSQ